jgi:hypothetical protein
MELMVLEAELEEPEAQGLAIHLLRELPDSLELPVAMG